MDDFIEEALRLAEGQVQETRPLVSGELTELKAAMRATIPVEGDSWFTCNIVVIKPGMSIPLHQHPEWICLYYAELAETPVIVDEVSILPKAGDFIVLPPNEWHEVCFNETASPGIAGTIRVTIAMKVEKDGNSNTEDRACYPSSPVPLRDLGDTHLG